MAAASDWGSAGVALVSGQPPSRYSNTLICSGNPLPHPTRELASVYATITHSQFLSWTDTRNRTSVCMEVMLPTIPPLAVPFRSKIQQRNTQTFQETEPNHRTQEPSNSSQLWKSPKILKHAKFCLLCRSIYIKFPSIRYLIPSFAS
jgi:hypothetical protein